MDHRRDEEDRERYSRYIVEEEVTEAGGMEKRECPLCHEKVLDLPGKKPTVFLFHLTQYKPEHEPLNEMCECNHVRVSHLDRPGKEIDSGPCAFSRTCGCTSFTPVS